MTIHNRYECNDYGGKVLPKALLEKAIKVKAIMDAIQQGGAEGDF